MSRCRTCRAPIVWVELPSGRRMPVDADPSPAVIVGFAIRPDRPSVSPGVTADQDVWGPNESEEW